MNLYLLVTVPFLFSVAAGFPFLSAVDTQEDTRNINGINSGLNSGLNNGLNSGLNNGLNSGLNNGINSGINTFSGLICQDSNEIPCASLNIEARCETTCSGYRVCFKACPAGAAIPGEQNLLCICRDGLVRNYQGFCIPRQACSGQQQHFFGNFGNSFGNSFANNNFGNRFGTRPWEATRVTPRMSSQFETTSFQADQEHERQTAEPENPFLAERKRQARLLAAKRRS